MHPNCKCEPSKPANRWQVKKENANKGKWFFTCSQCNFFQWETIGAQPHASPHTAPHPSQAAQSTPHAAATGHPHASQSPRVQHANASNPGASGGGTSSHVGAGIEVVLQLLSEDEFAASFPYSSSLVDLINTRMDKGSTGRCWDPSLKSWRFKMTSVEEVISIFTSAGCRVQRFDPRALAILQGLHRKAGPSSPSPSTTKGSTKGASYVPSMSKEEAVDKVASMIQPETLSRLFDFQKEGVTFIVRNGGRVLLADEPGLGKTVQALCAASCFPDSWPLLVICPSSMRFVWAAAVADWLPDHLRPSQEHIWVVRSSKDLKDANQGGGEGRDSDDDEEEGEEEEEEGEPKKKKRRKSTTGRSGRRASGVIIKTGPPPPGVKAHVCITSHALVQKMDKALLDRYSFIVVDESHCLKSRETKMTTFISALVKRTKHALLLTGTPLLSRPIEVWPQADMLRPGLFGTYTQFGQRYCVNPNQPHSSGSPNAAWFAGGQGGGGGALHWQQKQNEFKGASNLGELNLLLTSTIMVRRTKASVALQLPDKIRSRIRVSIDPSHGKPIAEAHAKLRSIDERRSSGEEDPEALSNEKDAAIQELFRATGPAKVKETLEFIESLLSQEGRAGGQQEGEGDQPTKILVFGHHQVVLDALEEGLKDHHQCIRIEGSTPPLKRSQLVDQFQADKKIRVAILSMTAAGVGLTLTAASAVVFSELAWNPSTLVQAEDRAHRIGQGRVVHVYYVTAQGTADDIMWNAVQKKLGIVGQALGEKGAQMKISPFKTAPPSTSSRRGGEGGGGGGAATTSAAATGERSAGGGSRRASVVVDLIGDEDEDEEVHILVSRVSQRSSLGGASTQDPIELE